VTGELREGGGLEVTAPQVQRTGPVRKAPENGTTLRFRRRPDKVEIRAAIQLEEGKRLNEGVQPRMPPIACDLARCANTETGVDSTRTFLPRGRCRAHQSPRGFFCAGHLERPVSGRISSLRCACGLAFPPKLHYSCTGWLRCAASAAAGAIDRRRGVF